MKKIRIFDNLFANTKSASLGGDNADEAPKHVEWVREGVTQPLSWFTDGHIKDVAKYAPKRAVAWLLEPRCLHPEDYEAALENEAFFEAILTHDPGMSHVSEKALYYPYGGSWILPELWGLHPKTKKISMIFNADKITTEGHKLRREIYEEYGEQIDVFGYGVNEVASKYEALAPYEFSVVIENCQLDGYFTEKLTDCFSVGTIPIYWGDPLIMERFNIFGVKSLEELEPMLSGKQVVSNEGYEITIQQNLELAEQYRCVEDTLYNHYPHLFGAEND